VRAGLFVACAVLAVAGAASAQDTTPDPKALFTSKCGNCHSVVEADSTPEGPSLKAVFNRPIASLGDFDYSKAMKAKAAGRWSEENLDAYLTDPGAFAPGGAMYVKVPDPAQRKAIIAYLKGQP
jgi:cytochrome c